MNNRRQFLKSLALGAFAFLFKFKKGMAQPIGEDESMRKFEWRVPKVHFETVKKELSFEGEIKPEKDAKGVSLVMIFVGAVLLTYLAKAVLALRREIIHGGIVIDTRGEKIYIDTDKSLPGGIIVMVTPEGTQLYERDEIGDPAELVSALMKGL